MVDKLKRNTAGKRNLCDSVYATMKQQYLSGRLREEERENLLFAPYHESAASFRCLLYLARHKDGVEPSKMADRMNILRQSATSIADHFEQKGYITRHTHPNDRRKILLVITPEGERLTDQMLITFRDYHDRISSLFTQEEIDAYAELRGRMHQARDQVITEILSERESHDKGSQNEE